MERQGRQTIALEMICNVYITQSYKELLNVNKKKTTEEKKEQNENRITLSMVLRMVGGGGVG